MNALVLVLAGRDEAPSWRSAATRRAAYGAGVAGLLTVAAFAAAEVASRGPHSPAGAGLAGWLAVTLAVSAAFPLAPRYPLLAWRLAYLGVLLTPLLPGQNRVDTGYYTVLTVTYVVAGLRYRQAALCWMAALTLVPVWLWTGPDWVYPIRLTIGLAVLTAALYGIGCWRTDRRRLAVQTRQTRQQRERNAVLEERARIAREMHDVVAHHMSMIAVQAETAPYRLAARPGENPLPAAVHEEFAALGQAAREALTDMRTLLGVLRSPDNSNNRGDGGGGGDDDGDGDGDGDRAGGGSDQGGDRAGGGSDQGGDRAGGGGDRADVGSDHRGDRAGGGRGDSRGHRPARAELAPQPQLGDVPDLVANARRRGARVSLRMPDNSKRLPQGAGLTVYRIVQESLSNAARHAPGAAISVTVEQTARDVRVTVQNGPPAIRQPRADGTGQGLTGMRERVALLGGELRAGPEPGGGFAVRAVLPAGHRAGSAPVDPADSAPGNAADGRPAGRR